MLARQTAGHHSSGSTKSRTSKTGHAKGSATKHKASTRRGASKKSSADRKLRDTGDIDVSGSVWKDLPPEELPSNDADDAPDDAPAVVPSP